MLLFLVWPLLKVENWFQKQILNENVYISLKSYGQYEMDTQVTEIAKCGVYEMDRQTKLQINGNATEIDKISLYFFYRY